MLTKIVEISIWPATIVTVVLLLRAPLSQLVPTLKRLKYKDLELEFEREAYKILSEAERDLQKITVKTEIKTEGYPVHEKNSRRSLGIRYSMATREPKPAETILAAWLSLQYIMQEFAEEYRIRPRSSTRFLVYELESRGLISKEVAKVVLELAALRNKVAHAEEAIITHKVSSAFTSSIQHVSSEMRGKMEKYKQFMIELSLVGSANPVDIADKVLLDLTNDNLDKFVEELYRLGWISKTHRQARSSSLPEYDLIVISEKGKAAVATEQ
ncbi:MAG: hypothetical protein OEL87_03225 [Nanoarchaeota archaeon]|nr:hypothetical protein [Nanoarchaeota archaeon]